ncbi:hypothetical protein JXQ31_07020 [candidate division KSB1 bacterium]|nr:hypothetical protein [candidate division KSB1 bacterium]
MKNFDSALAFLLKKRYLLLSVFITVLMISSTMNGLWVGDFWEHSAVVRELSTHPFSPGHPLLAIDKSHAFYSPYSLTVALFARLCHLDPVAALSIAGMVNLVLLLISLWLFVGLMFENKNTGFYALLFMLLLWGQIPWSYSSFFHLRVLNYVLPYPSTFSTALSFIAFSGFITAVKKNKKMWYIAILVFLVIVLLSHPYTFIFLTVGLGALLIGYGKKWQDYARFIGIYIAAIILALLWPYYPFFEFIKSGSSAFHGDVGSMYVKFFSRTWPALLPGVPLIIRRFKNNFRDPLVLMFLGFCLIYLYGHFFSKSAYGRVVAYLMFTLHFTIAAGAAELEEKFTVKNLSSHCSRFIYLCLLLLILVPLSFRDVLKVGLRNAIPGKQNSFEQYKIFSKYVNQNDVVLSDIYTSWFIPTFAGKVVASNNALAFVDDQLLRRNDVNRFFSKDTQLQERLEILKKYNVDVLIINKNQVKDWEPVAAQFRPLSDIELANDKYEILRLRRPVQVMD